MTRTIGIDLGTYNSAAAVSLGRGHVVMAESRHGRGSPDVKSFPSFVYFDRNGLKQLVGHPAKAVQTNNPELVVWGVKRLIGLSYEEAREKGQLKRFSYGIEKGPSDSIVIRVGGECYSPSHIMGFILREIKEDVENPKVNPSLGGPVERAVISVPAYFSAARTGHIVEAARTAGFQEVDTVSEPMAAVLRYGLNVNGQANVLTFDIGAGTLDVTLMILIQHGDDLIPGELCTSGDAALGGIDMDDMLVAYLRETHGLQKIETDRNSLQILREEVEKGKIRLSKSETTFLDLPGQRRVNLSRSELEDVLTPVIVRCRGPIRESLQRAGITAAEVDHVLFVGGPSHMPCIRRLVRDELSKLGAREQLVTEIENMQLSLVDPMECVAQGAALKAGRVIQPYLKRIVEGYGIRFGGYYSAVIKDNSSYPVSGKGGLIHSNPNVREVPVAFVLKRSDPEKSTAAGTVYKYHELGAYSLSITPTGDLPHVEVLLQVTDDKRLLATLVHGPSGQKVHYEGLHHTEGKEVVLQEDEPPEPWSPEQVSQLKEAVRGKTGGWTKSHLERLMHAAEAALELVSDATNTKVRKAKEDLESSVKRAVESDCQDPNRDCPSISNRAKELLNVLSLPEIAQITKQDFLNYLEQLTVIAQS